MRLISATDAAQAALAAATELAAACRAAVHERGLAVVAVSGGETPWRMFEHWRALAQPWERIHVAQVDERVAPRGDPRRNLARLAQTLVADGPLPVANLLAMPVEDDDLQLAAARHQQQLERLAGHPLVFDVVQLGLGTDGHTASLVPADAVLDVMDDDVAVTGTYQGLLRMTLTYPALNRARQRLWLVTGAAKAARVSELVSGESADRAPCVQVRRGDSILVADREALALVPGHGCPSPPVVI